MFDEQNNIKNDNARESVSQEAAQNDNATISQETAQAADMNNEASQQQISNTSSQDQELAQCKQRLLFLQAELENYKKRMEKERISWISRAEDQVIMDVLPIVDDMERAFSGFNGQKSPDQAVESSQESARSHIKGFELILKSLQKLLKEYSVEEIPYSPHFDPELYEAVMQVQSTERASGEVVALFQKGYKRHGRVLRPAQVSVAQ